MLSFYGRSKETLGTFVMVASPIFVLFAMTYLSHNQTSIFSKIFTALLTSLFALILSLIGSLIGIEIGDLGRDDSGPILIPQCFMMAAVSGTLNLLYSLWAYTFV